MKGILKIYHPDETLKYNIKSTYCKAVYSNKQHFLELEIITDDGLDHVDDDSLQYNFPQLSLNISDFPIDSDEIEGKTVTAIEYLAYEEMAEQSFHEIREEAFAKYDLTCLHIYHSLGLVKAGEICLFVFVSAPRRKEVYEALNFLVEQIKEKVAIFGKELFEDVTYTWKKNN